MSNNNKCNLKSEKGITMITLMVTVVILIILAGIAITSMNTGGVNQVKGDKEILLKWKIQ